MKATTAQKNKVLFAVLFAALAFDLAGRISGHGSMVSSSDFASTAEEDCTNLIYDGLKNGGKEAGCVLNYDNVRSEARVRRVTQTQRSYDLSDQRLPTPVRPVYTDCTKIEIKTGKAIDTKATDKAKAECRAENVRKEKKYTEDVRDAEQPNRGKSEEVFEIEITSTSTTAENPADSRVRDSFTASRNSNARDIAKLIREKADGQYKKVAAKQKEADKKEKEKTKLAEDVANCLKEEDGKARSTSSRMKCKEERLEGLEGKEAAAEFNSLRSMLRQTLESGNAEDRETAMAISESLAGNSSLTRSQRQTAQVLNRSGYYNNQILAISEQLAKAPANSQARMFHLQRLQRIQQQMAYEFNTLQQQAAAESMRTGQGDALDEVGFWQGSLMTSLSTAMSNPQSLMDSNGYYGRQRLNVDLDINGRTLRGIPGDPLVNTQSQFDALNSANSSGQRYVQQAINQIGANGVQNNMPRFTPGVQNNGTQQLPGTPVGPGFQPQNLPGQLPPGVQNNGLPVNTQQRSGGRTAY